MLAGVWVSNAARARVSPASPALLAAAAAHSRGPGRAECTYSAYCWVLTVNDIDGVYQTRGPEPLAGDVDRTLAQSWLPASQVWGSRGGNDCSGLLLLLQPDNRKLELHRVRTFRG